MITLEFTTFLGRFHPLLVHLPIGFLVLAIALEWFESLRGSETRSRLIPFAWLMAGLGGAIAALCGWYLGETGLYVEDVLFVHRWLGIALVIISFFGWWLKRHPTKYSRYLQNGFNILVLGMLFYEGHQGGNMTHGEEYLTEYAPESVKGLLGARERKDSLPEFRNPDSVLVYAHLVHPIFETKCIACHNEEVQRGGLNMASPESLVEGSGGDPIIVDGKAEASELFRRMTPPQTNIKFMPPTENPLTYDEIKVVEWWIDSGASFEDKVSAVEVSESMKPVLLRRYGLDVNPRPWYETVQLPVLEDTRIDELRQSGFTIRLLGAHNPLIDVGYKGKDLTKEQLEKLESVKEYITWLSLAGSNVKDEWMEIVSNFHNLTRLELEKTAISDRGVAELTGLKHLEVLNLYGTQITNAGMEEIKKIPSLKRVYLWGTPVTPQVAESVQASNQNLEVIMGAR